MNEFEIGEKVEVIAEKSYHNYPVGSICEIIRVDYWDGEDAYRVAITNQNEVGVNKHVHPTQIIKTKHLKGFNKYFLKKYGGG